MRAEVQPQPMAAWKLAAQIRATAGVQPHHRDDPGAFARECLGVEVWSAQENICKAVAAHHRVAVRSGHKIGKSLLLAVLALWWCSTRAAGKVVMTSSGGRQVSHILWPEITKLIKGAKIDFPTPSLDPSHGIKWADGRIIVGFSTDKAELMAGYSGAELLFLVDEASGVAEPIFEAVRGNMAGDGHILLTGNPTQTSGTFFDAFNEKRELWETIHVSSEETPNAVEGRSVIPGLATRTYVEEMKAEFGEDSPIYQVRVRGNFPKQGSMAVIALGVLEAALARWEPSADHEGNVLDLGVDVARFGDDDSVIQPRRGRRAPAATVIHGMDTVAVSNAVAGAVRELRRPGERVRIKVDVIGVGAGVADQVRAAFREDRLVEVYDINVSSNATADGFVRLRDQLWFALGDWLAGGGSFESDKKLEAELVAPQYSFDAQGRRKVESKDEIKKRLKRSPDRADGLALAAYSPQSPSFSCAPPQTYDSPLGGW